MTWVTNWGLNEVALMDPQLRNLGFWRNLEYYVNPKSEEIIELGTKDFPFKNIGLAFVEILNFHSHSDRRVTIFLKEFTTNYMSQTQNYIVNITEVIIDSYNFDPNPPEKAIIFGVKDRVNLFSENSLYNLLENDALRLTEKTEVAGITDSEKSQIQATDSNIYVIRSNFKLNNVDVQKDILKEVQILSVFIKSIYLQEK